MKAPFGAVMFATGRTPNVDGLGLETAGVTLSQKGAIAVDAFSRTGCASVYAVGDVTARAALTPVAIREGSAFAETVFNNNPVAVDHSLIPTAVFAEPELGTIGLTENEAALDPCGGFGLRRALSSHDQHAFRPERARDHEAHHRGPGGKRLSAAICSAPAPPR